MSLEPERHEYHGHVIEVVAKHENTERSATSDQRRDDEAPELRIDGQTVEYGQLPDGSYALSMYAYDWSEDLVEVARRYVDYRDRVK